MSDAANRGRSAEKKVRDYLDLLDKAHVAFTFNRNQDAHAAGGRFVPVAGDFQAFALGCMSATGVMREDSMAVETQWLPRPPRLPLEAAWSRNFIIEVKEVQHDFRLPYKNYSPDKVARVQKRVLAGTEPLVLIRFMPKDQWRAVPLHVFRERDPDKPSGSWDLSAYPFVDYRTAISEMVGFLP